MKVSNFVLALLFPIAFVLGCGCASIGHVMGCKAIGWVLWWLCSCAVAIVALYIMKTSDYPWEIQQDEQ